MKLTVAIRRATAGFDPMNPEAAREVVECIHGATRESLGQAVLEILGEQLDEASAGVEAFNAMRRARADRGPPA